MHYTNTFNKKFLVRLLYFVNNNCLLRLFGGFHKTTVAVRFCTSFPPIVTMNSLIWTSVLTGLVCIATAAPTIYQPVPWSYLNQGPWIQRGKRSNVVQHYVQPCATHVPIHSHGYQYIHHGRHATPYAYDTPYYRAEQGGEEPEMMNFTDMDPEMTENMPMARAYGAPYSSHSGLNVAPQASPGPAIGVFPSGGGGGCSVPLLLSCSPSIVQGHVAKQHPQYYGASASAPAVHIAAPPSYRESEQQQFLEGQQMTDEQIAQMAATQENSQVIGTQQ